MKDEGIVQPVSKEMEQLSRRLHQKVNVPRRNPGNVLPWIELHWCVHLPVRAKILSPEAAAYIAGLVDGEGTITLSRLHANENRRVVVSIATRYGSLTPRNGKYSSKLLEERHLFEREFLSLKSRQKTLPGRSVEFLDTPIVA